MSENKPWLKEPNRYIEDYKGLKILIRRHPVMLHLCGFVGVPKEHKFYGVSYEAIRGIDVHGGLSFSGEIEGEGNYWWFGFNCAHEEDYCPCQPIQFAGQVYRDFNYVLNETRKLAEQIIEEKFEVLDEKTLRDFINLAAPFNKILHILRVEHREESQEKTILKALEEISKQLAEIKSLLEKIYEEIKALPTKYW